VTFSGANASLDGRLFGPYGTLSQSAILGSTTTRTLDALRLETTWTYTVPEELLTYRAGDTISGGLAWTRPIRIGGVQMQRDFGLRPDLVTMPLPTISGSAAVPSTLDVYVNNIKVNSQEVPSGPYQLINIPVLSSAGTARVVMQDAAGHQIEASLPFYSSPILLREGLMDFSIEAGMPRLFYGAISNSYAVHPVGSASLRHGLFDWLTLEAHTEGGAGLRNLGVGTVTRLGSLGVLSLAGSGSQAAHAFGFETYLAFDSQIMGVDLHASSLQTFGTFNDLASVTASNLTALSVLPGVSSIGTIPPRLLTSTRPPKSLDIVSMSLPLPFDTSRVNLGYVHDVLNDGTRSDLANVSYSRSLFGDVSFYVTAFTDLHSNKTSGVFIGLSMPLGNFPSSGAPVMASTSVSATPLGTSITSDLVKTLQPEPDSYGWRLQDREGNTPYHAAAASYRSSFAQFDGTVLQVGRTTNLSAQAQGAVAALGGGVFLANRIDDAFTVANVGAPGVDVFYENRPVGKTDGDGRLLIPNLRSYQANTISIDARGLPLDADVPVTQSLVVPADRGGAVVDFGINTEVKAAVVILSDKAGKFIVPGVRGHLKGAKDAFLVGYDGRAYVKGLGATNTVVIDLGERECRASFPFTPQMNTQVVIGPVVCQ
jgi:outer membrane usher protein